MAGVAAFLALYRRRARKGNDKKNSSKRKPSHDGLDIIVDNNSGHRTHFTFANAMAIIRYLTDTGQITLANIRELLTYIRELEGMLEDVIGPTESPMPGEQRDFRRRARFFRASQGKHRIPGPRRGEPKSQPRK
jgi:hypothetical protein